MRAILEDLFPHSHPGPHAVSLLNSLSTRWPFKTGRVHETPHGGRLVGNGGGRPQEKSTRNRENPTREGIGRDPLGGDENNSATTKNNNVSTNPNARGHIVTSPALQLVHIRGAEHASILSCRSTSSCLRPRSAQLSLRQVEMVRTRYAIASRTVHRPLPVASSYSSPSSTSRKFRTSRPDLDSRAMARARSRNASSTSLLRTGTLTDGFPGRNSLNTLACTSNNSRVPHGSLPRTRQHEWLAPNQ